MNNLLVFSVFSTEYFYIPQEDALSLTPGLLPLTKKPKSNCKKCNGFGYKGQNITNLAYVPCSCVQKVLDLDILKKIENKYLPK